MELDPEIYRRKILKIPSEEQCKRVEKALADETQRNTLTHWVLLLLIGFNYVLRDTELYLLYFLLADELGCDFMKKYSFIMMITFCSNVIWRPLSGYLTDVTEKKANLILWLSVTFILFVQTGMIFSNSFLLLTIFQTMRNLCQVQMYNSIWKIFKLRLENKYGLVVGSQCAILSKVGVIGEVAELSVLTLLFVAFWLVSKYGYLSYTEVKYCFLGLTFFFNILCFILSLCVRTSYFAEETKTFHNLNINFSESENLMINESQEYEGEYEPSFKELKSLFLNEKLQPEVSPWKYLIYGVIYFWNNTVAFHANFHIILLYVTYSVLSNAEAISIPDGSVEMHTKTLENFCGGYFINTFFQAAAINISFLLGAFFYLILLKRTSSTRFYQWIYPSFGTILFCLSFIFFFSFFSQLIKSLVLSVLEGFIWFFILYDNFLVIASISSSWFGFYSIIYGLNMTFSNFLFSLLFTEGINNFIFLSLIVLFLAFAILHALWFGWRWREILKKPDFHFC